MTIFNGPSADIYFEETRLCFILNAQQLTIFATAFANVTHSYNFIGYSYLMTFLFPKFFILMWLMITLYDIIYEIRKFVSKV